jgi:hypothetical protein
MPRPTPLVEPVTSAASPFSGILGSPVRRIVDRGESTAGMPLTRSRTTAFGWSQVV